jgi:hypothetical protein
MKFEEVLALLPKEVVEHLAILEQNKKIAKMGGHTAKVARDDLEKNLGKTEITSQNNLNYQYINEIETK